MLRQFVKTRLHNSTTEEIVKYSQSYGIPINKSDASQLLQFIKKEKIDPFSEKDRLKVFRYIESNIGKEEAKKADQLLHTLAKKYNLDHYL